MVSTKQPFHRSTLIPRLQYEIPNRQILRHQPSSPILPNCDELQQYPVRPLYKSYEIYHPAIVPELSYRLH